MRINTVTETNATGLYRHSLGPCTPNARPQDSLCGQILICKRCARCVLHCTCPPPEMRYAKADPLAMALLADLRDVYGSIPNADLAARAWADGLITAAELSLLPKEIAA